MYGRVRGIGGRPRTEGRPRYVDVRPVAPTGPSASYTPTQEEAEAYMQAQIAQADLNASQQIAEAQAEAAMNAANANAEAAINATNSGAQPGQAPADGLDAYAKLLKDLNTSKKNMSRR